MKRTLIYTALSILALAGVAQADTTYEWDGESDSMTLTPGTDGNWSLKLSFNADNLFNAFKSKPEIVSQDFGIYEGSDALGKGLFTINGEAYQKHGLAGDRKKYGENGELETTFVMGWGNDWYAHKNEDGIREYASNGVFQGLQFGVADKTQTQHTNTTTEMTGYDMGGGRYILSDTFDVYRFDTKVQKGEGWTISEGDGQATVDTLDAIMDGGGITAADLYVVHSTPDGYPGSWLIPNELGPSDDESFTTIYFLFTLADGKQWRYMAQINDESTFGGWIPAAPGTANAGSAYYDVDFVKSITGINKDLITGLEFYDHVIEVPVTPPVPEPATATLSLLALTALAARRRRK